MPKEISVEEDLVPIRILPKERYTVNLIYKAINQLQGVENSRKDEGYICCKVVTGNISTRDIRLPFSCDIMKCPLSFSPLKLDMPVM